MKANAVFSRLFCALAALLATSSFAAPTQGKTSEELAWRFEYDDGDRITKVTDPAGREAKVDYSFDEAKRLRKLVRTTADGFSVAHEFDEAGQISRMTDGAGTVSYGYDDLGRLNRVQRQGAPAIAYTHDTLDRITSIQVDDFYRVEHRYDFLGRLASMKTPAGVIEYEYMTGQGQLVRKLPNGVWTIWTYEPNGDCLRQRTNSLAIAARIRASSSEPNGKATKRKRILLKRNQL